MRRRTDELRPGDRIVVEVDRVGGWGEDTDQWATVVIRSAAGDRPVAFDALRRQEWEVVDDA